MEKGKYTQQLLFLLVRAVLKLNTTGGKFFVFYMKTKPHIATITLQFI